MCGKGAAAATPAMASGRPMVVVDTDWSADPASTLRHSSSLDRHETAPRRTVAGVQSQQIHSSCDEP